MEPTATSTTTFRVPASHPAFDGHFPGSPILPGVVLLDTVLRAAAEQAERALGEDRSMELGVGGAQGWRIASAKFLSPVTPGETLTLELHPQTNGSIRFSVQSSTRPVASGVLQAPAPPSECCNDRQAR